MASHQNPTTLTHRGWYIFTQRWILFGLLAVKADTESTDANVFQEIIVKDADGCVNRIFSDQKEAELLARVKLFLALIFIVSFVSRTRS